MGQFVILENDSYNGFISFARNSTKYTQSFILSRHN